MRHALIVLSSIGIGIGCGGKASDTTPPPDPYAAPMTITLADGSLGIAPAPPAGGQQLTSDQFTVPSGSEKYFCWTFHSPADAARAITEIQPITGLVVHHSVLFQTIVDEPDGFFECPILVKASWRPIWAGGAGSPGLKLPEGVAFMVAPKTQYLVQFHLQNTADHDVTTRTAINLRYGDDPSHYQPAGLFALGSFNFSIPAGATNFQYVEKCNSRKEMHVFAAFPHMHKLGKKLSFEGGADEASASMLYQINPWRFGDQPMDPVDFMIHTGQFMRATCSWDNPGSREISYGESSDDEMCFMILFYYPFDNLDGCLD